MIQEFKELFVRRKLYSLHITMQCMKNFSASPCLRILYVTYHRCVDCCFHLHTYSHTLNYFAEDWQGSHPSKSNLTIATTRFFMAECSGAPNHLQKQLYGDQFNDINLNQYSCLLESMLYNNALYFLRHTKIGAYLYSTETAIFTKE